MSATTAVATPPRIAFTVRETAERLHVPVSQVYALVRAGQLEHRRVGKHIRIPLGAAERYLGIAETGASV